MPLSKQDFVSNQEIRWCPGCGDYSILSNLQKILPELGVAPENNVFISGIGCAGRLPYYINTYGFHTIHGRALTIATGLKIMRPELTVWVITGDGDALSIGGNHLLHALRRNIGINILLFNNRIYGLTKGQYSPTSQLGHISNTTPNGSIEQPLNPAAVALAAGASFVARGIDIDANNLQTLFKAAAMHKGTSFVEIYQNCNIFNDGAFSHFADKSLRAQRTVNLLAGKPLTYGNNNELAMSIENMCPTIVKSQQNNHWIHQPDSFHHAQLLANLDYPDFPIPLGILYQKERASYEELLRKSFAKPATNSGLDKLFRDAKTWMN